VPAPEPVGVPAPDPEAPSSFDKSKLALPVTLCFWRVASTAEEPGFVLLVAKMTSSFVSDADFREENILVYILLFRWRHSHSRKMHILFHPKSAE
jgi:hypothetical protein